METTQSHKEQILSSYFKTANQLTQFPRKESRKYIICEYITTNFFSQGRIYSEREVNEVLKGIYQDYALIRRCLYDFKFLDRTKDGQEYWVR